MFERHFKRERWAFVFRQAPQADEGIIIVVCVAFALTLLYVGGDSFFNPSPRCRSLPGSTATPSPAWSWTGRYVSIASFAAQLGQPVTRAQEEDLRFAALQELVDQRLMLQAAKRERIRVDNKPSQRGV